MSERALLVMASQHQQPAEVSLGNHLSELVCPDLRAGDGSKRSAIWAVTVAPNEEPERTGDTPIREVTLRAQTVPGAHPILGTIPDIDS